MPIVSTCSRARLVLALSIEFLVGARGGGATDPVTAGVLLITDAPTDDFDEVNVTVSCAELLRDGGQAVSISFGGRIVNLLALDGRREVFSLAAPAGAYSEPGLVVSAIELVKRDPRTGRRVEVVRPRLPAGGRLKLSPRAAFAVPPRGTLILRLGLDGKKSYLLSGEGEESGYLTHPVAMDAETAAPLPGERAAEREDDAPDVEVAAFAAPRTGDHS